MDASGKHDLQPAGERAAAILRRAAGGGTSERARRLLVAAALAGLALFLALVQGGYAVIFATNVAITLILTLSLNLVVGSLGLFSLAHGAFFGCGAYVSAVLATHYGVSPWLCLPAAMLVTVAFAFVIGKPVLRLRGFYLAVATLSFALFIGVFARQATDITGGAYGISGIPALTLFGLPIRGKAMLAVAGLVLLAMMILLDNLMRSRLGRAFLATRDNEDAAAANGIPVARVRLIAFLVSAVFASVAGWLQVFTHLIVNPFVVGLDLTFLWLFMILVGGTTRMSGVVLGTLFLSVGPELLGFASSQQVLMSGIIMLLVIMFAPKGLGGVVDQLAGLVATRSRAGS